MRAVPTWVDKVHDRDRNEQVTKIDQEYLQVPLMEYSFVVHL